MPKHFIAFLFSNGLSDEQIAEQLAGIEEALAEFTIPGPGPVPLFDKANQPSDSSEGGALFAETLQALEERHPFRAAVLEFQTLVRVLLVSCEQQALTKLRKEDYVLMLCLLDDLNRLTSRCQTCPLEPPHEGGRPVSQ